MIRHALGLSLVVLALISGACRDRSADRDQVDGSKPEVLTTFTVLADLARNVAGDRLTVLSIVKPGSEIHGYQPTPSDVERATSADLIVENGLGLELWSRKFTASAGDIPTLTLSDGMTVCQHVAKLVSGWAADDDLVGESGYSLIGAVVSPRDLESTALIRALMPQSIFLVPGFGAQGRTADEVARCFRSDGTGAIVAASRSVIYAFASEQHAAQHGEDWMACVESGAKEFAESLREAVPNAGATA